MVDKTARKHNGIKAMSDLTGLSQGDVLGIWDQVKANGAKLEGCSGHEFVTTTPEKTLGKTYRCLHCSGDIDAHAYHWYMKGRKHAGGVKRAK